ncbi:MAG: hypothetical protein J6V99_02180 [Neisseriaceae bacterium]|nr:hypothetical protein [Neisseriaceae bacterium]
MPHICISNLSVLIFVLNDRHDIGVFMMMLTSLLFYVFKDTGNLKRVFQVACKFMKRE